MIVNIPSKLNVIQSLSFIDSIFSLPHDDEYIFDFRNLRWSEPFGLLAISYELFRFASKHSSSKLLIKNHEENTYEGHMGFFKAFGLDHGKFPGEALGSNTYIPIKLKSVAALQEKAVSSYEDVGIIIENYAKEISNILVQYQSEELKETLTYSIREIIRNVVEHSESAQFGYCAQYWPTKNIVEFSLLEKGIGIRKTLARNPHLSISSDEDALKLSLLPGVSGKTYNGKRGFNKGVWANSGFGLYMTSRICGNGGSFFLISGDSGILLNNRKRYYIKTNFQGTALRLRLNTINIGTLSQILKKYQIEGYEIARQLGKKALVSASTASQMLSKDFSS